MPTVRSLLLVIALFIVLPSASAAFAKRPARPSKSGGGRGFGAASPAPRSSKRSSNKRPSNDAASRLAGRKPLAKTETTTSLEKKLQQQHEESCAVAASRFAIGADGADGSYRGGWERRSVPPDALSPGNEPYASDRLLLRSKEPLLSPADCQSLIDDMEAHGAVHGWDARYPVDGFTREVNLADIPSAVGTLNRLLAGSLLPAVERELGFAASTLRVNEALIVKYDAATGNNCLPVHVDFSLVTVNIALSDAADFDGGGTWFQYSGERLLAPRGAAVMHAGALPHCGVPVSRGTRYQLVLFLLSTAHADVSGRLQAIGAATGAKAQKELMDLALSTTVLERAVARNPRDGESWSQLAHNRWHAKDLKGAAAAFERVLELSGRRDFAALCSLAAVEREAGRAAKALPLLRHALEVGAPPSPTAEQEMFSTQHNAGMTLMELGQYDQAGLIFEQLLDTDPKARDTWAALGVCMSELDQPEAALACQRQVMSLSVQASA
jgi:Tfp pilus assembly protein PilF